MYREYSFCAHTLNFGSIFRSVVNPFTGASVNMPIDRGMTDEEAKAVREVFKNNGIEGPEPELEGYATYGDNGSSLRFRCQKFDTINSIIGLSMELVTPELTDQYLSIILKVARSGNLALTSSTGEDVCVIDTQPNAVQLKRWPDAITIRSVVELRDWLENTIGYREVRI